MALRDVATDVLGPRFALVYGWTANSCGLIVEEDSVMWLHRIGQFSILIPAILMLVAGLIVALRSVDVRLNSVQGVRQVVSNLSYTAAMIALCVAVLMLVQGIVGYNIRTTW